MLRINILTSSSCAHLTSKEMEIKMKNKLTLAVLSALSTTTLLQPALAQNIDISVESLKNTLVVEAHNYGKTASYQYRLKFQAAGSQQATFTKWQSKRSFSIPAQYGKVYKVTVEAQNQATGEIVQVEEDGVSLANLKQFKSSNKHRVAEYSIVSQNNATNAQSEDWATNFTIDFDAFPRIIITSDLKYQDKSFDGSAENLPLLTSSDISLREDGRYEDVTRIVQPDPNSSKKIVDIVFVHDDSGSLGDEAQQVRENILNFVQTLSDENFDYRIGLVPYGGYNFSRPEGTLLNNGSLTDDPVEFQSYIDQMRFDGSREKAFDAMHLAITGTLWRPATQKVVVLVTDEDNDWGQINEQTVIDTFLDNNVLFYGLTAGHSDFERIATAVSGQTFDVRSDFSIILNEIGADLTSRYQTQYESDNTQLDGVERVIDFKVDTLDFNSNPVVGEFSIKYTPIVPVTLELTPDTLALLGKGQLPGQALPIRVAAGSEAVISGMSLGYRHSTETTYTFADMSQETDGSWYADIPQSAVQDGSVQFYISAVTDAGTKTLPATDPQTKPMTITVFPNVPPEFSHTPIESAPANSDIIVTAMAEDATNAVATVSMYYRESGAPLYTAVNTQFDAPTASFEEIIPASAVTSLGVEYFLVAVDDFGSETFIGSPEQPLFVNVDDEVLPAACNEFGSIKVCANDFTEITDSTNVWASGNVQLGLTTGNSLLGFSGTLVIDSGTNEIRTLSSGRVKAVDIVLGNLAAKDIPLGEMSFEIDGGDANPELIPTGSFGFRINSASLSGETIAIADTNISIPSELTLPLYLDYADVNSMDDELITLGDLVLSQNENESSLAFTIDMDTALAGNNSKRIGKFGGSGMRVELDSLEIDLLKPAMGFEGEVKWNQSEYELETEVGLNPVQINRFGFEWEDLSRKSFISKKKIPIGTTGFVIAHSNTALEWQRVPDAQVSGSITGYFSDAAGGLANIGSAIDADILSGSLALTVKNGAKTWIGSGNLELLEQFELASAELTAGLLASAQYGFNLSGQINIGDVIVGNALLNGQSGASFTQFHSLSELAIQVPKKVKLVGGKRLAGSSSELLIKSDHTDNDALTAYFQVITRVIAVDVGVKVDFSDPSDINFDIIKKPGSVSNVKPKAQTSLVSAAEYELSVGADEDSVLFSVQTTAGLPELEIVTPSGSVIKASDITLDFNTPAPTGVTQFAYDNGDNQTVIGFVLPEEGDYTVRVLNDADVAGIDVAMTLPVVPPRATLSNVPQSVELSEALDFDLEVVNLDSSATVEVMLKDSQSDLILSLGEYEVNQGANSLSVTLPSTLNPGEFKLVSVVKYEGMSADVTSETTISIENSAAPAGPTDVSVVFNNSHAMVYWTADSNAQIESYLIRVENLSRQTTQFYTVSATLEEFMIQNLSNGDLYEVSIASMLDTGVSSGFNEGVSGSPVGMWTSGSPDLGFALESVLLSSETEMRGEPIQVAATVTNSGAFPAYSARFNCYIGTISSNTLVSSQLLGNIDPDMSVDLTCNIDQSEYDVVGSEIYLKLVDVQLPDASLTNNGAVVVNPYAKNVAPEGESDTVLSPEDVVVDIDVMANDKDRNGDEISIESVTQPRFGKVTIEEGLLRYTPDLHYYGTDEFTYTLSDGELTSEEVMVDIELTPVNDAPIIVDMADAQVSEGDALKVESSVSDVDNTELSMTWVQTSGVAVEITDENAEDLEFTAPYVESESTLTFELSVSDGELVSTSELTVVILNDNASPTVTVSGPAEVEEGDAVSITSVAEDIDDTELTVSWQQTSGPTVSDVTSSSTGLSFTAPSVDSDQTVTFTVTVADNELSVSKDISVSIKNKPEPVTPPQQPTENNDSGGGSSTPALVLLGLFAAAVRRLTRK